MKKLTLTTLALFISMQLTAQTKKQISQLYDLCNVWGNLKYFHPEIASGKYNWDSVLVVSIDQIMKSEKEERFLNEIDRMIQMVGKNYAPKYKIDKSAHPYTYRNINNSWVDESENLTLSQKKLIKHNYSHPYQGINYYAEPNKNNEGTVVTAHENPYKSVEYPNIAYRLLGLFRYWNVINYFYPYKYAIGETWKNILLTNIPEFINATNTIEYQKSVAKLAASINDSHGILQPYPVSTIAGKYRPPFIYQVIEDKCIVTKIADIALLTNADIKVGYVIDAINDIPISQKIQEYWDYISASNTGGKVAALRTILLRSNERTVSLKGYKIDGTKFTTKVNLTDKPYTA